jgi:hypothetical protein
MFGTSRAETGGIRKIRERTKRSAFIVCAG